LKFRRKGGGKKTQINKMNYESFLSQEKPLTLASNKLCLNTYEQQLEIDGRLNKLMRSLIRTDDLRNQTEATKNHVKFSKKLELLLKTFYKKFSSLKKAKRKSEQHIQCHES
jgi:hypothetical protein